MNDQSDQAKKRELMKVYLLTSLKEIKMSEKTKQQRMNPDLIFEPELPLPKETPEEDK